MLVEQDFSAAAAKMLLEQQIAARAASICCSSNNLLLEQHFFSAAAEVKVSTPLVRHRDRLECNALKRGNNSTAGTTACLKLYTVQLTQNKHIPRSAEFDAILCLQSRLGINHLVAE
ncbi:hypothetical protein DPMN_001040 [Dreissena polymorpha]|uniref:Uncharacterized protein n=1 Tax=Dreissena polymorpha TaxID=45954 RepID=A0A9D4MKQ1_DREPO|nr:hypothetical protein DPMN_001040 [Dreissena polymorpha]